VPTVLLWRGYRFFFWSGDRGEPPHVHVRKGSGEAKIWLDPVRLDRAVDLSGREVNLLLRKVAEQQAAFMRAWHGHFGR
jgi:hypothetical protein